MANVLYPKFKQSILSGTGPNLPVDNLKVALIHTASYTFNAADQYLSAIPGGAIVVTSSNLTGKSVTNGIFTAGNLTLVSVTGLSCEALIIYQDTGVAGTSQLIAYFDTGVSGLPVTPNGGNIAIQWNGSGVFSL
jgi:hypothetical protein